MAMLNNQRVLKNWGDKWQLQPPQPVPIDLNHQVGGFSQEQPLPPTHTTQKIASH